ncbi:hypothetical protein BOTBODRAFT_51867 [Botryobasidium botryosum FD-172 SS1]|uniref:Cyanovirin-N domain-containing protein n=1 Tax=Botryobasidium botryosum (strain FD-172 SS1) TaxID=930990 RepID=A0A067N5R6_BOTB1|nr:hypothetical protein BOTBODRAFT_51867 [Botryobasidium botryosum FD-172 SS1]
MTRSARLYNTSNTNPAVLVVGAGPTGLFSALSLAINGVSVRVIERNTTYESRTRGTGLNGRTLEALASVGVLAPILEHALVIPRMRAYAPNGRDPLHTWDFLKFNEPSPDVPYSRTILIPQDITESILRAALEKYDVHVELGSELVGVEQDDEGVTAHVASHLSGSEMAGTGRIRAEWLIGADGGRSQVRKSQGIPFLGETPEADVTIVASLHIENYEREVWSVWGGVDTARVLLCPLSPSPRYSMILTGKHVQATEALLSGDLKVVQDTFNWATGRDDLKIIKVDDIARWRPNIRMAEKFSKGRVFLAGDAAHTHPPAGGQGLNASLQDAHNLAWKVALVHKKLAPRSLLHTYDGERMPVITEMLDLTASLYRQALTKEAGNVSTAKDIPKGNTWNRETKLNMMGVNCRWSPIVVDERTVRVEAEAIEAYGIAGGVLRAGDRAPDAPALVDISGAHAGSSAAGQITTSLFELFGPAHHTALVFSAHDSMGASATLRELDSYNSIAPESAPPLVLPVLILPADSGSWGRASESGYKVVVDSKGHAMEGYQIRQDDESIWVMIVRPDGVVGAIVKGSEGIEKYFSGVLVMSFPESLNNIHVDSAQILRANCQRDDGQWDSSDFLLNTVLGNIDGQFFWDGQNFGESAQNIHLVEGGVLVADLRSEDGGTKEAQVYLGERIRNINGVLMYK